MKFNRLFVLLPCRSFDDLSLRREAAEANQLFAAWSALWHPLLLAAAESLPAWAGVHTAPGGLGGHLLIIPPMTELLTSPAWVGEAEAAGACIVRQLDTRSAILEAALRALTPPGGPVDVELAADFMALGIGQFLLALSDRRNHYGGSMDETVLRTRAVDAAKAAVAGDAETARRLLQSAFDGLHQSREYYYPSELHLLDLTLVCDTTIGAGLRAELAQATPRNLLLSGAVIEEMARREPATLDALRAALERNTAALVGGELSESELPLLPPEAIALRLRRGAAAYERHLGRSPTIFGRRRFGLSPVLPQILRKHGFQGALHFTLDDGTFPVSKQSRIRWEGIDGGVMETLSRIPMDAGAAEAFLLLPEKLGDVVSLDHVTTLVLAHWPGRACPWYDDLQRVAAHSSILGKFAGIIDYFRDTEYSGQLTRYEADRYQSPYLRQAVAREYTDPISRWVRYYCRRTAAEACQSLSTFTSLLGGMPPATVIEALLLEIEDALDDPSRAGPALDQRLQEVLTAEARRLADALVGGAAPGGEGLLVLNPWAFSQRVWALGPGDGPAGAVEAPGLGFAWIGLGTAAEGDCPNFRLGENGTVPFRSRASKSGPWWRLGRSAKEPPPLAESGVLRNEFFEAHLSPTSGAVQSVSDYQTRGNRLSQQIALRSPRTAQVERDQWGQVLEDVNFAYSIMAVDEMGVTACDATVGEITSHGRLLERDGQPVARFCQVTRVRRGSRILELEIELETERQPEPDPWKSYYGVRWAWEDDAAEIYRGVQMAVCSTDAKQLESPHFIDIRNGARRTTILCGGLPYHRRQGPRMLDTLLVVRGETSRQFRLGVGFDRPYPMAAAIDFLAPRLVVPTAAAPSHPSGWFFHVDAKNVVATHWEPVVTEGQVAGFRVRLLETEGRRVSARLRSFRAIRAAERLDNDRDAPVALPAEDNCVAIEVGPYQWIEVQCLW